MAKTAPASGPEFDVFSAFLKRKGLSSTRQRALILEEAFKTHSHFEADEVVAALRARRVRVGRATVYRNLAHLEECGLVRKVDLGHGHSHFEHVLGHQHHEHLCCRSCGKIIEFSDARLEAAIRQVAQSSGFSAIDHSVIITGLCPRCASTQKGASPA